MKRSNLPTLNARYWAAILAASLVGTTLGDFISQNLHLGFIKGLIPLSILLAITFLAERRAKSSSEAYYWTAIVLTRTAATNIADLGTHQLKLNYTGIAFLLAALLVGTVLIGRKRAASTSPADGMDNTKQNTLPATDACYWTAILIASTLGTTLGDFVADGLGLGVGKGSVLLGAIVGIVLYAQCRANETARSIYWVTVVVVRTAGTIMGDFLSTQDGLHLGFAVSATCTGLLLIAILQLWRK